MKINQNCINCIHNKVCCLTENYEKYEQSIYSYIDKIETNENFSFDLHIKCNNFTEIPNTSNFKDFNYDSISIPVMGTVKSCEECEFYNKLLKTGGTYIGDSPCSWCYKNQFTSVATNSSNKSNSKQTLDS